VRCALCVRRTVLAPTYLPTYLPACLPACRPACLPSDDARSAASMCCTVLSLDLHPDMARPLRSCASVPLIFLVATCNICCVKIGAPSRLTYRPSCEAPAPWCRIRPGKANGLASNISIANMPHDRPIMSSPVKPFSSKRQPVSPSASRSCSLEIRDWSIAEPSPRGG
jgi:hypothetical protein